MKRLTIEDYEDIPENDYWANFVGVHMIPISANPEPPNSPYLIGVDMNTGELIKDDPLAALLGGATER